MVCIVGGPGDEGTADTGNPGIGGILGGSCAGGKGGCTSPGLIIDELPFGRIGGAFERTHGGGLGRLVVVDV